eukprot:17144_1
MADDEESMHIKVVVVGDGAIGKTCLLIRYEKDEFATDYIPTVFERVTLDKTFHTNDGEKWSISLDLWDTAGQEEFDRLRHLAYRETDIFLLCFCVVVDDSFRNLKTRWLPEVQHHSPDALLCLVGLKCDLKAEHSENVIPQQEIEEYRVASGAAAYIETSAMEGINVDKTFDTALSEFLARLSSHDQEAETEGCCMLL